MTANVISLESLGFNMKPQEPTLAWRKQKFITIGAAKSGKTKFWAGAGEKAFWFRTEAGHNHVKTIGCDCRDLKDYETWKTKLFQAKNAGIIPFDTIVIDTGDRFIDYITEDIIERARQRFTKMEINSIGEIPEGQGWYALKTSINILLKQLEELDCAISIIFHVGTDTLSEDFDTRKTFTKETINVGGKTGKSVLAWADHIIHIRSGYVGDMQARKLVLRGNKTLEAGTRGEGFPVSLNWGNDDQKNFDEFRKLFS